MSMDASKTGSTLLSYGPSILALRMHQDPSWVCQDQEQACAWLQLIPSQEPWTQSYPDTLGCISAKAAHSTKRFPCTDLEEG